MTKLQILIVKQLKNFNFYKTQTLQVWKNSKTQIVTKLKKNVTRLKHSNRGKTENWNCDETQKLKYNCDKAQKLKLWQHSKIQIVTKLKNSNCDKTQKIKLWQNTIYDKTKKK